MNDFKSKDKEDVRIKEEEDKTDLSSRRTYIEHRTLCEMEPDEELGKQDEKYDCRA